MYALVVTDQPLVSAVMLGLGGGMRSFAPAVAFAVNGRRPLAGPGRFLAFAGGAGELIVDKLPQTPSRWSLQGVGGRVVISGAAGWGLDRWRGAGIAALAAVAAAYAGSHLRIAIHDEPLQLAAAVMEDTLSYGLVLAAVRGHAEGTRGGST